MGNEYRERALAINAALKDIILRHMPAPDVRESAIPGLMLARREAENSSDRCFSKPVASLFVQGHKVATLGAQEYHMGPNQCLVCAVDMPSLSRILDPTPEAPFLSLFFLLDRKILGDLIVEMGPENRPAFVDSQGVSVADADIDFMETMLRLAQLLDKPRQIAVRAPIILRELHYLLLIGPQGGALQGLYQHGTQDNQVVRAISLMKENLAQPLRMEDLARQVGMSVSSLHRHFKGVTGISPLQYHKQLRLYEAQRMMLMEGERAAGAAIAVGYESVTQFNREYKRMFGEPPLRDITRRRAPIA